MCWEVDEMAVLETFRLDGKVAVVTGGSSGLGVTFALALAEAGADVVLAARREDKLAQTVRRVESLGRRAIAVRTDVTNPEDCQRLVARAMATFGNVDVLVNNAGLGTAVPATRETPEQFRSVIELNLNACYWMAQAAGKVMRPGSSIINISSALGMTTMGLPQAAYSSSKAALIGLTRDLAQQWTPRKGIRVNALAPGYFESEMTDQFEATYINDVVIPRTLFGRLGKHEEIGAALLFLASQASGYVTGITLPVEGGILAT
jgi:NAD(P)-dependent dehydrogenase (short-subunit alcohol dehydrogenase family)